MTIYINQAWQPGEQQTNTSELYNQWAHLLYSAFSFERYYQRTNLSTVHHIS